MSEQRLTTVRHHDDGMIEAWDQFGAPMPEYRGPAEDVLPRLRREHPDLVPQRGAWIARQNGHEDPAREWAAMSARCPECENAQRTIEILRGALADIATSDDMTLDLARRKAKRIYDQTAPPEDTYPLPAPHTTEAVRGSADFLTVVITAMSERRLTTVRHLDDGTIEAWDQFGAPMSEYHGPAEDVLPRLRREHPDLVPPRGAWIARSNGHQ